MTTRLPVAGKSRPAIGKFGRSLMIFTNSLIILTKRRAFRLCHFSSRLRIFPVAVIGSVSTIWMIRGYL